MKSNSTNASVIREHSRQFAVILFLFAALPGFAVVKPADQFSADQVMSMQGQQMTGRIFVDAGNMRTEMQMQGMPQPAVSIVNGERKVLWIIMPGNMYMEKLLSQDEDVTRSAWTNPEILEHRGSETIDGTPCEKFQIKSDEELYLFVTAKDGLPVRMISADGRLRIEWKNAKKGPQPASLFQLPAGLKKFALPALPGGLKLPGM